MKTPRETSNPQRPTAQDANGPEVLPRLDPPIRILISSRNEAKIPDRNGRPVSLLTIREALQTELEEMPFCGQRLLKVWINEKAGGESGDEGIWETCRGELDESQIIIALVNGEAGWCRASGLGICHEEIKHAFDHFPTRLYLIRIGTASAPGPADLAFEDFLADIKRWEEPVTTAEDLIQAVKLAVAKAVRKLTISGSRWRKGVYSFGTPLAWSRLGYPERKARIEEAARSYLLKACAREQPGVQETPDLLWKLDGAEILLCVHGVPSSYGIAEAREMVGRPHLSDHLTSAAISGGKLLGPVHIIACHKTCPESRVFSFLGHPDVYIVKTDFGFFAVDLCSFVQTFFLVDCRDHDSTVLILEQVFGWIAEADEEKAIVDRARSRQRILAAIRSEVDTLAGHRPVSLSTGQPGALASPATLGFGSLPA